MIKRINHLEATNVQLRQEAEKLQAERTAYRLQIEAESQAAITEREAQIAKIEGDLARIRNARDELIADVSMRKATQDQERTSFEELQELAAAREARIESLESERDRLRLQTEKDACEPTNAINDLPLEELRVKYASLEKQLSLLNGELSSMQTAYKKTSSLASSKTADRIQLEEKCQRLAAEKSRADQKYFAAMKVKETREVEVRGLRLQLTKSSEIVTQLKEAEAAVRALVVNLEKSLAETNTALSNAMAQQGKLQQQATETGFSNEALKKQITELTKLLTAKDESMMESARTCRKLETDLDEAKGSLAVAKKSLETWKKTGSGKSGSDLDLRVSPSYLICQAIALLTSFSDLCFLRRLQQQRQRYPDQDLRPPYLQRLLPRPHQGSFPEMSSLRHVIRYQRYSPFHTLRRRSQVFFSILISCWSGLSSMVLLSACWLHTGRCKVAALAFCV